MSIAQAPTAKPDTPATWHASGARLLALVALVVAALVVASIALSSASAPSETAVASALLATAASIDEHAAAMVDHGQRLAASALAISGPQREHWIADADHMITDGNGLRVLAERLRQSAARLGEAPMQRSKIDVSMIRGEAVLLKAEGEAAVAHGRAMVEHGVLMEQLAREPGSGIRDEDVAVMRADGARIVSAGEATVGVATMLIAASNRFERSLGIIR